MHTGAAAGSAVSQEETLSRSPGALSAPFFLVLLIAPVLSCDSGNWPGAPEGYNYRTAHIVWKLDGNYHGTREEYIETAGYKDGKLLYKRYVTINRYDQDAPGRSRLPRKVDNWTINENGVQYNVINSIRRTYKFNLKLDQYRRLLNGFMWREILFGVILRPDLTQVQRDELKKRIFDHRDEDLANIGAKITTDTFLGHKVKRYEIPTNQGRAILLLYGDIPLKQDLTYRRPGGEVRKLMVATKLELNKKLPDAPFTPPKDFKLIDASKKIPGS